MIIALQLVRLAAKQAWRSPARSLLTVLGIAAGIFLVAIVGALQSGLDRAVSRSADDVQLVVFRANRYCPSTSHLPLRYGDTIAALPGVAAVLPQQVHLSSCGTSMDVVAFRGVPAERFPDLALSAGSMAEWRARSDGALIGSALAQRRGLQVGERFAAAGITVTVCGIIASDAVADRNLAWVQLDFLSRAARTGVGMVTQFGVTVQDPTQLDAVARAIDEAFASEADPTHTAPEQAFLARAAGDLLDLVGFTRWVGLGAIGAVLLLAANTALLAARGRIREFAIFQTIGFAGPQLAWLVLVEGLLFGLIGGLIGALAAGVLLWQGGFALTSEGLSVVFQADAGVLATAVALALGLGLVASLAPALQTARRPILAGLRNT